MRASSACASSSRNDSGRSGSISNAWPEAELPVSEPCLLRERLVQQLADRDGVRGVHRVGGGEIVVLAGVDDDPGAGVHLPGEALVDECAHRVDVAEEDPVHRVVQHHVQPVQPRQRGDLGHAQPGGVVGQPDVAAQLAPDVVQRGPHQPEVLPGRVGAGVALPGGSLRHVVQQALPRGADHRDHVRPGPGGGLGLRDVLVDVAGGDDQVDPGPPRRVAEALDQPGAGGPAAVDPAHACCDRGARSPGGALGVPAGGHPELDAAAPRSPGRRLLRQGEQVRCDAAAQRVPDRQRDAVLQADVRPHGVGQVVDPGHPLGVGTLQPGQPERGPLHRHRGVGAGEPDHRPGGPAGQPAGGAHGGRVERHARRDGDDGLRAQEL